VHFQEELLGLRREEDGLHLLGRVCRLDKCVEPSTPHLVQGRAFTAAAALAAVARHDRAHGAL